MIVRYVGLKQENEVCLENMDLLIINIYVAIKAKREGLQSEKRCGLRTGPQENRLLRDGQRKSLKMKGLRIKIKAERRVC